MDAGTNKGSLSSINIMDNPSDSVEEVIDQNSIAKSVAFVGDYPYDMIKEGLKYQFSNYMNLEDTNNYVDIFYDELENSYAIINDENAELVIDDRELLLSVLDEIHNDFVSFVSKLFNDTMTITFRELNEESIDYNEIKDDYSFLYDFFIINAKDNFKKVISSDILSRIKGMVFSNDNEFYAKINELLSLYNPLITGISPEVFLTLAENDDVKSLFDNGDFLGNFLRRYSPKIYQNEDFKIELIVNVTMLYDLRREYWHGTGES